MIDAFLGAFARGLIHLRYRVRMVGLEAVRERGRQGILFLPNHPALIDPVILATHLMDDFRPVFLADEQQIDRPVIRQLARHYGVRPLPDVKEQGAVARREVERALVDCAGQLNAGKNVAIYPSGHVYRGRYEDLRGNSAAHRLVQSVPEARVVLVRTRGLWGSGFGWASGQEPRVGATLKGGLWGLFSSAVFFAPKREVVLEFVEPSDLPRTDSREVMNQYLEEFYNQSAPPALRIPYSIWSREGAVEIPEPLVDRGKRDTSGVPEGTRRLVLDHLQELTGVAALRDDQELARHLGLDSLARAELLTWVERETGIALATSTNLDTVGDVILAACGEAISTLPRRLSPVPRRWVEPAKDPELVGVVPAAQNLLEAFLARVGRDFDRPLVADQTSGVRTVGDLVTGIFALKDSVGKLPGDYLGVLLPASVAATLSTLTILFSEKTPVMVNWTLGSRHLASSLDGVGVQKVLTSRAFVERLGDRGVDLSSLSDRLVFLEDLGRSLSRAQKLRAYVRARLRRSELERVRPREHAVVLFTSGSEAAPKAVPLTHANILANLRDATQVLHVTREDCLLGMLPPFHSFGFTVCIGGAVGCGLRVAYYPDPTDAGMLARLVEAYRATFLVGTPTFIGGIVQAGKADQLHSVRLVVTGAEACSDRVAQAIRERCPKATILEGYGITECSPIVALPDDRHPRPHTVGPLMPSLEHAIVHLGTGQPVAPGEVGMLLIRGPSIFEGYLPVGGPENAPASPFVEHDQRLWYKTGDLVSADPDGYLTFRGRLKRFVKIGGEMVSLPAIESVLEQSWPASPDQGPALALVAAATSDRPELVLFTTTAIERAQVNQIILDAGLSPLHSIRRVVQVESLPLLGSGKTDYRELEGRLTRPAA